METHCCGLVLGERRARGIQFGEGASVRRMAACVEVAVIEDKERELCPDAGLGPDVRALAGFVSLGTTCRSLRAQLHVGMNK